MTRDELLFHRALHLICTEWGKTNAEALEWLNADDEWAECDAVKPGLREEEAKKRLADSPSIAGNFIQRTRTTSTKINPDDPFFAGMIKFFREKYGYDLVNGRPF